MAQSEPTLHAACLSKYQSHDANAPGALYEHGLALSTWLSYGLKVVYGHPRRCTCNGKSGCLFIRQIGRDLHNGPILEKLKLGEDAMVGHSRSIGQVLCLRLPRLMQRETQRENAVANLEAFHIRASGDHFTNSVGTRHQVLGEYGRLVMLHLAFDHLTILVVEADRTHLDQHLRWRGGWHRGCSQTQLLDTIETGLPLSRLGFHRHDVEGIFASRGSLFNDIGSKGIYRLEHIAQWAKPHQ